VPVTLSAFLLTVALVVAPTAQLQLATVTVVLLDTQDRPVAGAAVRLTDALGADVQQAVSDAAGRATFTRIAPGHYRVTAAAPGMAPFDIPAQVAGALPIEITLRVPAAITSLVVVEGATDDPSTRASLATESLALVPIRGRARGLQDAVATLPGWATEDNGLLHARGVDDGFLYVIDGVPVYERLDAVSGIAPDLSSIGSLSVITGYVPPEFGHKAGGVIDIRSAAAQADWSGAADVRFGSVAARDASFAAGGRLGAAVDVRAGLVASRSDRFLDPIHPDNFHNVGGQSSTYGQLGWSPTGRDRVTAGWGVGRSRFDVPNTELQEEVGQDQRQRVRQRYLNATWQRSLSPQAVLHASAYARYSDARLDGSANDTPLEAHSDRSLRRTGALLAATYQQRQHLLKVGLEWQQLSIRESFQFAVTDEEAAEDAGLRDAVLDYTPDDPFTFDGSASPDILSLFVQDAWQAAPRLTISGGVRFDRSRLLLDRSQWSPRLGGALRVASSTVMRAAVSRFFQPPQPEHLLLSSSPEARALSSIEVGDAVGGADVEPERQWGVEAGVDHALTRRVRLDAAYWRRRIEHAADPNVFAGTTIIFPNAVAKGRAHGLDVRLEAARDRGWSGYASWSLARVIQTGPFTGGLFLEDEVDELGPGVEFAPDHDQRVAAGGGVTWVSAKGLTLAVTARYESGTPVQREEDDEDELEDLPGAETVDFENGRVRPRTVVSFLLSAPILRSGETRVVAGFEVLNLFNAHYAYNFGNPFSGTHFGAPRAAAATLRVTFD
jgi:hypothetical protein